MTKGRMNMEKRRVVVTGAGVVSALGGSRAELFEALLAGRCAVRRMPEWCAERRWRLCRRRRRAGWMRSCSAPAAPAAR